MRKLQVVVRARQRDHRVHGLVGLVESFDHLFELAQRERLAQLVEHALRLPIEDSDRLEALSESHLVAALPTRGPGGDRVVAGRRHVDAVPVVDDPGAEHERGDMALAARAQAHQEPDRAVGQLGLVRVQHHRRIEERHRLEGVLQREVGPRQQAPVVTQPLVAADQARRAPIVLREDGIEIGVAIREPLPHLGQQPLHLLLRERPHHFQDGTRPLLPAGQEKAGHDPRGIGVDPDRGPAHAARFRGQGIEGLFHPISVSANDLPFQRSAIAAFCLIEYGEGP
ncbi:MAG: hypothetical protein ACYTG3_17765 [Planctomycetota bacterium]|jgi:hypothetical protein